MPEPLRVALLIESSRGYGRNLLAGIAAYARTFGPWTFYHEERAFGDPLPLKLRDWRPQGVIARLENRQLVQAVRRLRLPTVGVLHEGGSSGIPGVLPDHEAIVRLAIEHFLERRLEHFAFCGLPGARFSENRCRCFVGQLAQRGYRVEVFQGRRSSQAKSLAEIEHDAMRQADQLAAWLRQLPKPTGLLTCNDMRAFQVLSVCREHGISVPDEVAVLGVDNDAVECELCDPPLSSIDNNAHRVGFEAASLLDRMIRGEDAVPDLTLIEPVGAIARRSTNVLAVADRDIAAIVRHVRDHACEGLTPPRLAKNMAVSRSTLERWFTRHLGRSVNDEIRRVQLERVKDLLATSDLPLGEIAQRTGFLYPETMQRVFKNAVGQTPGQYRADRRMADR